METEKINFIASIFTQGAKGGQIISEQVSAINKEEALGKLIIENWNGSSITAFKVTPILSPEIPVVENKTTPIEKK